MDGATGTDTTAKPDLPESGDVSQSEDVPAVSPTGEQLFGQMCAGCHGAAGEGTALGYELQHVPGGYATWVIRHGREGTEFEDSAMPAFSPEDLSDQSVGEIVEWLNDAPMPTSGEGLYNGFCANCHGQFGLGGVVGHDLLHHIDDGPALYIKHVRSGHNLTDYGNRTGYMPAWTAEELPDSAIELMIDYLAGK